MHLYTLVVGGVGCHYHSIFLHNHYDSLSYHFFPEKSNTSSIFQICRESLCNLNRSSFSQISKHFNHKLNSRQTTKNNNN